MIARRRNINWGIVILNIIFGLLFGALVTAIVVYTYFTLNP